VGVVKKTRMTEFPEGDVFPFNYEELSQRYGKVNLEREATTVQLATPEQVAALTELLSARKDGDDLLEKWLTKAMADTVEELPSDAADKCIAFLTSKKAVMA
jgi:hypothetical protein